MTIVARLAIIVNVASLQGYWIMASCT
jgi:hypothetical protein